MGMGNRVRVGVLRLGVKKLIRRWCIRRRRSRIFSEFITLDIGLRPQGSRWSLSTMFFSSFFSSWPSSLADQDRSSLPSGRSLTYTSNVISSPNHQTQSSAEITTATDPRYGEWLSCLSISSFLPIRLLEVYYRVFFEDGAVPTLHSATPDDPFLRRALATSIAPPHNLDSLKRCLAKHEDIDHRRQSFSLFLTRSSSSPMDNTSEIDILKPSGTGSTPQEALALVMKLPDSVIEWGERPALVNHEVPTGTRFRKKFVPCFYHCPFLMSSPIIYKSTTGCTTKMANCHRECLSTRSTLHSGASKSIGLHRLIQLSL